jgi:alpha-glucosidase
MLAHDRFVRFERVGDVQETGHGVLADLHGESLRIDVVRDDVVRLKISRGGVFDEAPTFAVDVDPLSLPVDLAVEREDGVVRVRTAGLVVSLWLDPFRLDVHRPDGSPVVETAQDEQGRWWPYATLNDAWTVRRRCAVGDAVHGLGEKGGAGDRRGRAFVLWNTDVLDPARTAEFRAGRSPDDPRADMTSPDFDPYYVSIPFFHHQRVDGAVAASFVDDGHRGHYDFTGASEYRIAFDGGQYTEYVFAGPDLPAVLEAYTWLTGRTAPPPLWALGYHQCRYHVYDQATVEALARRHRDEQIPCDGLWLDIEHMDGYRVFTWDRELFPDPAGMLERLHAQGFRVVTIVDPGIKREPGYHVHDEAVERGVLCRTEGGDTYVGQVWPGDTVFPDFVTPEARAWWGGLNAEHVRSGLDGIWNDMNEPATGVVAPEAMRFDRGRDAHERWHNSYALLMAMATVDGLREAQPELRTFVLSRAGSAGIQRCAANWMGDNQSRWDHLQVMVPMANGFGLSGQAFVGADVGGFFGDSTGELFLRWLQAGVLTPFCRNHTMLGSVDQYAWAWGGAVRDAAREAVRLRYRLLPYLYATFLTAAETGAPVQRTARLRPPVRPGGAPAGRPVRARRRPARRARAAARDHRAAGLPAGRHLVRLAHRRGPDRPPLGGRPDADGAHPAVRARWGGDPDVADGAGVHGRPPPEAVELHLYVPGSEGTWTSFLQEDDGVTTAAERGARVRTGFTVTRSGERVVLLADVTGDGYPEFARERFELVLHGAAPAAARLDGRPVAPAGRIEVPSAGTGFRLELDLGG